MRGMNVGLRLSAVACIAVAAACAQTDSADDTALQDTAPQTTAVAGAPTDADIAHIVVTANTIDIDAGQLAKDKGENRDVVQFADRMITDHTGVNEQATQLVKRLNVTPTDNATSQSLKSSADQTMSELRSKSGRDFDRTYIDHEVAYHQQVLDALDSTLIPNAQNAELKTLLEQTRPAIAAHLDMAKRIQTSLAQ